MDIQLIERLASAGACLEGAQEQVGVGGPEWVMIGKVIDLTERLIEIEVKGEWPAEIRKEDFERKAADPADIAIPPEVYRAWWTLFDAGKALQATPGSSTRFGEFEAALAAIPADMRP